MVISTSAGSAPEANTTRVAECEAVCSTEISIETIAQMQRDSIFSDLVLAAIRSDVRRGMKVAQADVETYVDQI
jgi:hypothetical protein